MATAVRENFWTDLDPAEAARLRDHAAQNGRSCASEIRLALKDWIGNDERPEGNPGAGQNIGTAGRHEPV